MTRAKYYDNGQGIAGNINAATATFGAVAGAVNTATNLVSGGLSGLQDKLLSGTGLNAGAEAVGDIMSAVSMFSDTANANDWRVRLSLPKWASFQNSAVLTPLKDAGGMVFPYTPQITIKSGAKYSTESVVHTNYPFNVFKNSEPGAIEITASMNVEDSTQALYWIASVHYLRSIAKMFSGMDPKAGNPPPIVFLNGYGNYVFKNVPVVITNFNTTLPNDCDYIACDVVGSAMGEVEGITDSLGSLSDTLGSAIPGLSGITNAVSNVTSFVGQAANILGTFGVGGTTSAGTAYVPTKSSFSITLQPVYSRNSARKFSLDRFVQGGYVNNSFGYI